MVAVELARQQWEEGHRRLEREARDRPEAAELYAQVEAITEELRRRVGETFTLTELARVYAEADDWSLRAAADRSPGGGALGTVADAQAAAFHLYSRGAVDYRP